jgi:hypothetical protein
MTREAIRSRHGDLHGTPGCRDEEVGERMRKYWATRHHASKKTKNA